METCHSEYGRLISVVLKPAQNAFVSQDKINAEWESLNYLAAPDFANASHESDEFRTLIGSGGAQILELPENPSVTIDSIYCRDASFTTDFGVIICNMGKGGRINEPLAERVLFEKSGIQILGEIESPGTVEGGDVAWLDEKTVAIGRTYRTNPEGIRQFKNLLEPRGIEVIVVELPHYKGPSDVFHLMSILSPVDKDLAVVYSPLMPIWFREELKNRGFEFVECPDQEFESKGCNVLAIAPRECLMVAGNDITKKRLEEKGAKVTTYKGWEISEQGSGGPTCLTRPILRQI